MLGRVVKRNETTYGADYRPHTVQRVRSRNLNTAVTTGVHYCQTPRSLYQTDIDDFAATHTYQRPTSARQDLYKLPPQYDSTVRPHLDPDPSTTNYQQYFGRAGMKATVKRDTAITSRELSKTDQTDLSGTTKGCHHPPGYGGHLPREWKGNRGKVPKENSLLEAISYQYHTSKAGYSGFIPSCESTLNMPKNLEHTSTTYRDMCDEVGFKWVDNP